MEKANRLLDNTCFVKSLPKDTLADNNGSAIRVSEKKKVL